MKAAFDCAVCYQIDAKCITPLRTGGADGDRESVLRDIKGRAFVQGTSLAGALREWQEKNNGPVMAAALFGSQSSPGSLIVSDGVFDAAAEQQTRPRVRIDRASGTADDGGKFDVAHIRSGAVFRFSLVWLGHKDHMSELQLVEEMLAALNAGAIRLGGQKSNGFGRVSLSVGKRLFDMADEKDREAWLADDLSESKPLTLPTAHNGNVVSFILTGRAESLLVRASAPVQEDGGSYTPNMSENGVYILPGSAVKGAVRARAEAIAKTVGLTEGTAESLFGRMAGEADNGFPGRAVFEDVYLKDVKSRRLFRIHTDKFTGGVMRKGLFKEAPVSGWTELRITAPDEPVGCALLLYALRDLGIGLYNVGGDGSIGRGYLTVESIQVRTPDNRTAKLVFEDGRCSVEDREEVVKQWLRAWEDTRDEDQ